MGTFNQTGGIHTFGGTATLNIVSQIGGVGIFNLRNGTLAAGPVVNNGTFNMFGGTATVGVERFLYISRFTYTPL